MTVEHSNTENTTALRIYYCGREQCAPGHFWGPAIRPHYLLHVVLHGKGEFFYQEKKYELSAGDARSIGVKAPIRESGDLEGSAGCKLVGPKGEVELKDGVIIAKRHIHMTPEDAEKFGLSDKQVVSVKVDTAERSLIFGDVVVRVSPKYALAMHIDTDESNAAGCVPGLTGDILD